MTHSRRLAHNLDRIPRKDFYNIHHCTLRLSRPRKLGIGLAAISHGLVLRECAFGIAEWRIQVQHEQAPTGRSITWLAKP